MGRLKLVFLFLVLFDFAHGQSSKYFKKLYGTGNGYAHGGSGIIQLPDSGYLVSCKYSQPGGFVKSYMLKLDKFGNLVLKKESPDTVNSVYFENICYNNVNDIIVGGAFRDVSSLKYSSYVVKMDTACNYLNSMQVGDTLLDNIAYHTGYAHDSGYVFAGQVNAGSSNFGGYILKTDYVGNLIDDAQFYHPYINSFSQIEKSPDKGYYLWGTQSYTALVGDYWLMKIDSGGNVVLDTTYHIDDVNFASTFILRKNSNQLLLAGGAGFSATQYHPLLMQADSVGNILWYKYYNNNQFDPLGYGVFSKITELANKDIVGSGSLMTASSASFFLLLFKIDSVGNVKWFRLYNPYNLFNNHTYGYDMVATYDGGFIICGRADTVVRADVYIVKTNCLGFADPPQAAFTENHQGNTVTFVNLSQYGDTCIYNFGDGTSDTTLLTNTNPVIHTYPTQGPYIVTLTVYACGDTNTFTQSVYTSINDDFGFYEKTFIVQPNPAQNYLTVNYYVPLNTNDAELALLTITGKKIKTFAISKGRQTKELNIEDVAQGVYFLNLFVDGKAVAGRKVVVIK